MYTIRHLRASVFRYIFGIAITLSVTGAAVETALSRNAQVFKFFAQQSPGIPRKHLAKMAYMADLISRQYLGHPISTFNYILYLYGPYPVETAETVNELVTQELARSVAERRGTPYDPAPKRLYDAGKAVVFDFSRGENEILAFVVRSFLKMDTEELVEDVVYETEPFRRVVEQGRLKAPLDMDIVNGQGTDEVGFDLERVLAATAQAEAGDSQVARAWFDGLRNHFASRYAG